MKSSLFAQRCAGLLGLCCFAAFAQAAPVIIEHAQGRASFETAPSKTVVFDLATLDNLQALGVPVAAVPNAKFPAFLKQFADERYAKVGSLFEPDYDAVKALKPDVIIVAGRSSKAYAKLSEIAPTIDLSTSTDHFVADVQRNLATLGQLYGRQEKAAALSIKLKTSLDQLHAKSRKAGNALMLFAVNGNVNAQAPGARFGIVYEVLGLSSVLPHEAPREEAAEAPRPAADSPEAAARKEKQLAALAMTLKSDPQWLLVLDRGAATGGAAAASETLTKIESVRESKAWKAGRVFYVDPAGWYLVGGGVSVIEQTLAEFAKALQSQ